jgi:NAD+ synthase (glutamine-hydrolysing)
MQLGLAQINTVVGDLAGNREKILAAYRHACDAGAELVLFPELVVCGYPPRDLLFKRRFVPDVEESLIEIAAQIGDVPALIGFVETNPGSSGRPFFNAAAWCRNGEIEEICRKCLLPSYDVFDEDRYFAPCPHPKIVSFGGKRIGITICEDIWSQAPLPERPRYEESPLQSLQAAGIDLLLNLSASPWHEGKGEIRRKLVAGVARFCQAPVVLCNAVGGNDELVFDGDSLFASRDGTVIASLAAFREEVRVIDLDAPRTSAARSPAAHTPRPAIADIEGALVLGLHDYARKSGFEKALIGLSGGIDSAVTAVLAVRALGADRVIGVSLPSAISSEHSKEDARQLALNLGIRFETLPIHTVVEAAQRTLTPLLGETEADTTEENLQARARGLLLMALSNKWHALLLTTGNKSELSVGYCTLYGDMAGGLAVLSDLPKTKVFELAEYLNRDGEVIPRSSILKPPSAELRPGQVDQDSLPPYPLLDAILERYVEWGESSRDIVRAGFPEEVVRDVVRKVDLNEYKRKQAPPGLKLTPIAFGTGRRLPLVQRYVS